MAIDKPTITGGIGDPFGGSSYPTAVLAALSSGASFARFDPTARWVAAGRPDGIALIWSLDTRAVIRYLDGHVKAITSIDWSRNSRFILTASRDWNIVLWDLASDTDPPRRLNTIRFDAPILSASFHPRNMQIILVVLTMGEVYLVDLRHEHGGRFELFDLIPESATAEDDPEADANGYIYRRVSLYCAQFDPSGRYVFVGTSQGTVLVFNTRTKMLVMRYRIAGAGAIRGLSFAKYGRRLLTNSSDRVLRQFNLPAHFPTPTVQVSNTMDIEHDPNTDAQLGEDQDLAAAGMDIEVPEQELEPTYRFSDPINKVAWHNMAYSPDGEWVAGGSAEPATHKIYIWDIENDGQFATALDGGREPLIDVSWHPHAPMIASTTNSGNILLWHCPTPERWGAFAGGFEEFDENVEYEEREDEFDVEDEEEMAARKRRIEDAPVDVLDVDEDPIVHEMKSRREREVGDEDVLWAESEPDEDYPGWRMKVIMVEDEL